MTKITEVVRTNVFVKSNQTINEVIRKTSCSSGWLRVVVQTIFGFITVTSFILIVLMAVSRSPSTTISSCVSTNCRVKCGPASFNDGFERDVVSAVLEAGLICDHIILSLSNVRFPNETLPQNVFTRMPSTVERLSIEGGNLRNIPQNAFLAQFSGALRALSLEQITIACLSSDTFVGLRSLETLIIKESNILNIEGYALRAIDETVKSVTINADGNWNPGKITGWHDLEELAHVDFSHNDFGDSINATTFKGLRSCKVLYLNSCKITSIGAGAFDYLTNIRMLFLNDNYLTYVPPGLFATILRIEEPKPRIHLQDNRWKCNCSQTDLILLSKHDMLLVDPVCYGPDHLEGIPISSLEQYCTDNEDVEIILLPDEKHGAQPWDTFNSPCVYGSQSSPNSTLRIVSPVSRFSCGLETMRHFDRKIYGNFEGNDVDTIHVDNVWMKPSFLFMTTKQAVMEIDSSYQDGYGLVWLKSTCPNELHCINVMPRILRVYSVMFETSYTFCPMKLSTSEIDLSHCVSYNTSLNRSSIIKTYVSTTPFSYAATGIFCLFLGAMCVYGVIRRNPTLLKGSKRILFVKHRNVDALVLPPKIPLRTSSVVHDEEIHNIKNKGIYSVLHNDQLYPDHFHRSNSVRSDKSSTPTYVSAMQPTELQLAEWRIRNHFDNNDSIISISSDISRVYWVCDGYEDGNSKTLYESLK